MKAIVALAALFSFTLAVHAQQKLGDYQWKDLAAKNLLHGPVTPMELDGREVLKIENTNDAPLQVNLLAIDKPAITSLVYEVTGEVRYDSVQGGGYLEMWNHFPPVEAGSPPGEYFSRTLGDSGPMGKISGTSGWRDFVLPFDRTGATNAPTKLEINLFLPGRGTVYLGPVKLLQLPKAKSAASAMYPNGWWSPSAAGRIFIWGGGIIGCLGGLCGWLSSQGRARRLVMGTFFFLSALGLVSAIAGAVGAFVNQPFFVWTPLLLTGVLLLIVCPFNLKQMRRNYEVLEMRRMVSLDVSGAS